MNLKDYEREFYAQDYMDFEDNMPRIRRALKLIGTNKKVLDVGCWDGVIAELIKNNKNEVTGVDISPKALEKARQRGIDTIQCDIEERIDSQDETFDVVYMGDVIEHLFDEVGALSEVYRVLKKEGKLILTTVNMCSLRDRMLVLCGHIPAYYGVHRDHIRMFNKKKLIQTLEDVGFKINRFEGLMIEMPYTPHGRKIVLDRTTKRFATFATHFIVEAEK